MTRPPTTPLAHTKPTLIAACPKPKWVKNLQAIIRKGTRSVALGDVRDLLESRMVTLQESTLITKSTH